MAANDDEMETYCDICNHPMNESDPTYCDYCQDHTVG